MEPGVLTVVDDGARWQCAPLGGEVTTEGAVINQWDAALHHTAMYSCITHQPRSTLYYANAFQKKPEWVPQKATQTREVSKGSKRTLSTKLIRLHQFLSQSVGGSIHGFPCARLFARSSRRRRQSRSLSYSSAGRSKSKSPFRS